jgi:hypothetical protein
MTTNVDGTETVAAAAATAEPAASPAGTEGGSPTSGEAVVEQSPADRVEDSFLEKFGIKEEEKPAAVEPKADPTPEDEPPAGAEGETQTSEATTEPQPDAGEAKTRLTDDEFKALSPKAQQRLGYLTDQARRAKRDRDQALSEVETYRTDSEALTTLRTFATERNLRPEDVTASLNVAAMVQSGDFAGFLQAIQPWYTLAMEATGQALSPDVEQMVESGEISRDVGLRMTKTEREAALAEERAEAARAAVQARQASDTSAATVASIRDAVIATEAKLKATDPEWSLKAPAIKAQFKTALQYGARPATPEAAAQMLRDIHAGVVAAPRPQPRPTNPAPDATPVDRHAAPPKNTLELIEREWESKFGARA